MELSNIGGSLILSPKFILWPFFVVILGFDHLIYLSFAYATILSLYYSILSSYYVLLLLSFNVFYVSVYHDKHDKYAHIEVTLTQDECPSRLNCQEGGCNSVLINTS